MQMYLSKKCSGLTEWFNKTITYIRGKVDEESGEMVSASAALTRPVAETSDPLFQRLPVQVLAFHPKTPFFFKLCHNPPFSMLVLALTSLWPQII